LFTVASEVYASRRPLGLLKPEDLWAAYNLGRAPLARGDKQTVAIVAFGDDPNAEADMNHYRAAFGLPQCTSASGCFKKVDEFGGPLVSPSTLNFASQAVGVETSLDLDMVSAMCPRCHVIMAVARGPLILDLANAAHTAALFGASAVSTSYGAPEGLVGGDIGIGDGGVSDHVIDQLYAMAGTVFTVASGDDGYVFGPDYPASSPNVIAVGGTVLQRISAGATRAAFQETAWNKSGSACSRVEAKPPWQTDPLCPNRTYSDLSADAAGGVDIYDSFLPRGGGWIGGAGTSESSPLIAGVFALAGNVAKIGKPGQWLYAHRAALFNIADGTANAKNCADGYLCRAVRGYNGPTGLGTPNGLSAF